MEENISKPVVEQVSDDKDQETEAKFAKYRRDYTENWFRPHITQTLQIEMAVGLASIPLFIFFQYSPPIAYIIRFLLLPIILY
jgi:hypothetical protein